MNKTASSRPIVLSRFSYPSMKACCAASSRPRGMACGLRYSKPRRMQQGDQSGVAVTKPIDLLQPSANQVRAARQTLADPSLQSRLLLFVHAARAAFMAKIAQPLHAILLIGAKPTAHRIIVKQQRFCDLCATPPLVQKNYRIGP